MKNWTGSKHSVFVTTGATGHAERPRVDLDYYATSPEAIHYLMIKLKQDYVPRAYQVWEPAAGEGHLVTPLKDYYGSVVASDIIDRGKILNFETIDFLKYNKIILNTDIITNPPYRYALEFVKKALERIENGKIVAMFLKLTFLEGQKRLLFFQKYPPRYLYVFSKRITCVRNGEFEEFKNSSATAYGWYVWIKGNKRQTEIKWIDNR